MDANPGPYRVLIDSDEERDETGASPRTPELKTCSPQRSPSISDLLEKLPPAYDSKKRPAASTSVPNLLAQSVLGDLAEAPEPSPQGATCPTAQTDNGPHNWWNAWKLHADTSEPAPLNLPVSQRLGIMLRSLLASRTARDVLKSVLAYAVSLLFCFNATWTVPGFGDAPVHYVTLFATCFIISPPGVAAVGVQVTKTAISFITMLITSLVVFLLVSWLNDRGIYLICVIAITAWLLGLYRFLFPDVVGEAAAIGFTISTWMFLDAAQNISDEGWHPELLVALLTVYSCGLCVCLCINVLLFPKFSIPSIELELEGTCRNLADGLDLITHTFAYYCTTECDDCTSIDVVDFQLETCAARLARITTMVDSLRFELNLTRFDVRINESILFSIKRLHRHLASMSASLRMIAGIRGSERKHLEQIITTIKPGMYLLIEGLKEDLRFITHQMHAHASRHWMRHAWSTVKRCYARLRRAPSTTGPMRGSPSFEDVHAIKSISHSHLPAPAASQSELAFKARPDSSSGLFPISTANVSKSAFLDSDAPRSSAAPVLKSSASPVGLSSSLDRGNMQVAPRISSAEAPATLDSLQKRMQRRNVSALSANGGGIPLERLSGVLVDHVGSPNNQPAATLQSPRPFRERHSTFHLLQRASTAFFEWMQLPRGAAQRQPTATILGAPSTVESVATPALSRSVPNAFQNMSYLDLQGMLTQNVHLMPNAAVVSKMKPSLKKYRIVLSAALQNFDHLHRQAVVQVVKQHVVPRPITSDSFMSSDGSGANFLGASARAFSGSMARAHAASPTLASSGNFDQSGQNGLAEPRSSAALPQRSALQLPPPLPQVPSSADVSRRSSFHGPTGSSGRHGHNPPVLSTIDSSASLSAVPSSPLSASLGAASSVALTEEPMQLPEHEAAPLQHNTSLPASSSVNATGTPTDACNEKQTHLEASLPRPVSREFPNHSLSSSAAASSIGGSHASMQEIPAVTAGGRPETLPDGNFNSQPIAPQFLKSSNGSAVSISGQTPWNIATFEAMMMLYYFLFGVREFTKETVIMGQRVDHRRHQFRLYAPWLAQLGRALVALLTAGMAPCLWLWRRGMCFWRPKRSRGILRSSRSVARNLRATSPTSAYLMSASTTRMARDLALQIGDDSDDSDSGSVQSDSSDAKSVRSTATARHGRNTGINACWNIGYTDLVMKDLAEENELFQSFKRLRANLRSNYFTRRREGGLENQASSRWRFILHSFSRFFTGAQFAYANKLALAMSLFSLFLVSNNTRDLAFKYHLEWALASIAITTSPILGSGTGTHLWRIGGSLFGGFWAAATWFSCGDNKGAASIMTLGLAAALYYVHLTSPSYRLFSIITLGSFTSIYYSRMRSTDDSTGTPIVETIVAKTMAMCLAVAYGMFFTWGLWPRFARTEVREELAQTLNDLSLLMRKNRKLLLFQLQGQRGSDAGNLSRNRTTSTTDMDAGQSPLRSAISSMTVYSTVPEVSDAVMVRASPSIDEFLVLEFKIQHALVQIRGLVDMAVNEPRILGPFPRDEYLKLVTSCQLILDRLLTFRMAAQKATSCTFQQHIFPVLQEHSDQLIGLIIEQLYMFSGALKLNKPLPPARNVARKATETLLNALYSIPRNLERTILNGDIHYVFVYFGLRDIVQELEAQRATLVSLFGEMRMSS